ncbi:hypothetical protein GCM10009845_16350 [Pedococcus bigeumensis]
MQDREEWMREISAMVPGALPPRHVYERLATLAGLGAIEWIDSSVRAEGRESLTGRVVAFTARHLVVFDLDGVSGPQALPRQFDDGTTLVRVLPRSALRTYSLTQVPGVSVNTAEVWSRENFLLTSPGLPMGPSSRSGTRDGRVHRHAAARAGHTGVGRFRYIVDG